MDWEYYLRLTRLGYKFGYLSKALAHFRWYEESTTQKHWQRMIDEGLRAQREHITQRNLPAFLNHAGVLQMARRLFQIRRMLKRARIHGRLT